MTVVNFASVPPMNRALANALNMLCIHLFGDVPSPIAIGLLKDRLAPGCRIGKGREGVGEACFDAANQQGLEDTEVAISLWLMWTVVFWAAATRAAKVAVVAAPAGAEGYSQVDGGNAPPAVDGEEGGGGGAPAQA